MTLKSREAGLPPSAFHSDVSSPVSGEMTLTRSPTSMPSVLASVTPTTMPGGDSSPARATFSTSLWPISRSSISSLGSAASSPSFASAACGFGERGHVRRLRAASRASPPLRGSLVFLVSHAAATRAPASAPRHGVVGEVREVRVEILLFVLGHVGLQVLRARGRPRAGPAQAFERALDELAGQVEHGRHQARDRRP